MKTLHTSRLLLAILLMGVFLGMPLNARADIWDDLGTCLGGGDCSAVNAFASKYATITYQVLQALPKEMGENADVAFAAFEAGFDAAGTQIMKDLSQAAASTGLATVEEKLKPLGPLLLTIATTSAPTLLYDAIASGGYDATEPVIVNIIQQLNRDNTLQSVVDNLKSAGASSFLITVTGGGGVVLSGSGAWGVAINIDAISHFIQRKPGGFTAGPVASIFRAGGGAIGATVGAGGGISVGYHTADPSGVNGPGFDVGADASLGVGATVAISFDMSSIESDLSNFPGPLVTGSIGATGGVGISFDVGVSFTEIIALMCPGGVFTAFSTACPLNTGQGLLATTTLPVEVDQFGYNQGWRVGIHTRVLADVNGDGLNDIVGFGGDGVYVSATSASMSEFQDAGPMKFDPVLRWSPHHGTDTGGTLRQGPRWVVDVNGDGKDDIVGYDTRGHIMVSVSKAASGDLIYKDQGFDSYKIWYSDLSNMANVDFTKYPMEMGDINGDKWADVVWFSSGGAVPYRSNGEIFHAYGNQLNNFGYDQGWRVGVHSRHLADVNGDGKDDIVGFGDGGVLVALSKSVALSNGDDFNQPTSWYNGWGSNNGYNPTDHPRTTGDFNGDGKADIILFGTDRAAVRYSNGSAFVNETSVDDFSPAQGFNSSNYRTVADMNGDGLDDIVGVANGGVRVALAHKDESVSPPVYGFDPPAWWSMDFGKESIPVFEPTLHPVLFARMGGRDWEPASDSLSHDKKADIVGFHNSGVVIELGEGIALPDVALPKVITARANANKCLQRAQGDNYGQIWLSGDNVVDGYTACTMPNFHDAEWLYEAGSGYIRSYEYPDRCLAKEGAATEWDNGKLIQHLDCNSLTKQDNLKWDYEPTTGYIKNRTRPDKCIKKKEDGWPPDISAIHLWDCTTGIDEFRSWTIGDLVGNDATVTWLYHNQYLDNFLTVATGGNRGRYVRISLDRKAVLSLAEVKVFDVNGYNIALNKPTSQSSDYPTGSKSNLAVDGNDDGNWHAGSVTATSGNENPWWEVDLGSEVTISRIEVYNRTDCCGEQLNDAKVEISSVSAVPPPEPPVADLNGSGTAGNDVSRSFIEDGGAVEIAPAGTVADADGDEIQTVTITLTNNLDGIAAEGLYLTSATNVTIADSGTGTITLTSTGTTTNAQFTAALQAITYNNTSDTPDTTNRSITVVANDGMADSATGTVTMSVAAANDPPSFTDTPTIIGAAKVWQTLGLTNTGTNDVDGDTVALSYQWKAEGANIIIGAISSTYTVTTAEKKKTITCTITADDGNGGITTFTTAGVQVSSFPWLILMPGLVSPNKVIK